EARPSQPSAPEPRIWSDVNTVGSPAGSTAIEPPGASASRPYETYASSATSPEPQTVPSNEVTSTCPSRSMAIERARPPAVPPSPDASSRRGPSAHDDGPSEAHVAGVYSPAGARSPPTARY